MSQGTLDTYPPIPQIPPQGRVGPPLFLDQTEARKEIFLRPAPPASSFPP